MFFYQKSEADLRYVEHLCRRAKIVLSLVFTLSEDNYCFALLRSCLTYLIIERLLLESKKLYTLSLKRKRMKLKLTGRVTERFLEKVPIFKLPKKNSFCRL